MTQQRKFLTQNKQVYPQWMSDESRAVIKNKHKVRQEQGVTSNEYKKAKATSKILVKTDKMVETERDPPSKQYYNSKRNLKQNLRTSAGESRIRWNYFNRQSSNSGKMS